MRALVILVNADRRALRHTEALLSEAGHLVATIWSFVEAKKVLDSVIPDLLVRRAQRNLRPVARRVQVGAWGPLKPTWIPLRAPGIRYR